MLVFIMIPVAIILLISIAWLALSKNSSPLVRRAAVIALILIGLSVIASLVMLLTGPAPVKGPPAVEIPPEPVPPPKEDSLFILLTAVLVIVFFTLITILAARRERRLKAGKQPPGHEPPRPGPRPF